MEENEVESGLWLAAGPSPASVPSSLPRSVSSPNTTESPTSPATSGTAGYIIAAIIVSQVITAREHPPRLQLRQEGEGPGRGRRSRNEHREGGSEWEGGGSGGEARDSQRYRAMEEDSREQRRGWGRKKMLSDGCLHSMQRPLKMCVEFCWGCWVRVNVV